MRSLIKAREWLYLIPALTEQRSWLILQNKENIIVTIRRLNGFYAPWAVGEPLCIIKSISALRQKEDSFIFFLIAASLTWNLTEYYIKPKPPGQWPTHMENDTYCKQLYDVQTGLIGLAQGISNSEAHLPRGARRERLEAEILHEVEGTGACPVLKATGS